MQVESSDRITVVFCTYQSLNRLSEAQKIGTPEFDLIICDEAHRTTGIDKEKPPGSNQKNSNFVSIHNQDFISGRKRLYMTATPRIYTEQARQKADVNDIGIFSMDDERQFGKEFYRLSFSQAVEEGMLSDYRVIVLTMDEASISRIISGLSKETVAGLSSSTDDIAKIIGCYKALRDQGKDEAGVKLKRAVSFSNTIKNSKQIVEKFSKVVKELNKSEDDGFTCDLDHVDGKQTALARAQKLDWLRADVPSNDDGEVCRILSNARCLTEGIDVPSLDAILFMNPRKSQVDVVQAVGRVMRKAEGKDYGYVILPVVIPSGVKIEDALDSNDTFGVVWEVLRALRAHDDRLVSYISKLEMNDEKPPIIDVVGGSDNYDGDETQQVEERIFIQFSFGFPEELANHIYAKIVEKVGDKRYLEQWAKDTAKLHDVLIERIDSLRKVHPDVSAVYDRFLNSLRASIHDGLDGGDASSMLAQQLITRPVFDTLFDDYQFSRSNVVSADLDEVLDQLNAYGLDKELDDIDGFYQSVKRRVSGLDNDTARQKVITELYENFFTTAFPKTSESLGIAYTPIELVDFTLFSADKVMRKEFGRGLTDEGVHIIDPFTGTGSFLVRLLSNPDLINESDLHRKFTSELWANEILLLAYYIASVNIEMAHHQRESSQYQPFPGISLTDTFELFERDEDTFPEMLADNNKRVSAQRIAPIRVVVGNPPWSRGQKSENDNNANRKYKNLDKSIRGSYAARSKARSRNALYDSYIRAIRWASNRIGNEGMVAFVTNAGWLESTSADGMRLCLEEEFDAIWLFNLRGDARTSGEKRQKEKGNVFGQASRAPVVISLFIKNPHNQRTKAEIHYHDIGDYLSIDDKLDKIRKASIANLDWKCIKPSIEGDWLNSRDPLFSTFVELGNDKVKRGKVAQPETIFRSYSGGVKTNRDAWAYNFSKEKVAQNMARMIGNYNQQCNHIAQVRKKYPDIDIKKVLNMNPTLISWNRTLKSNADKNILETYNDRAIVPSLYRPFTMEYLYFDRRFIDMIYRQPHYFPESTSKNRLIGVSGRGITSDFSCLMTDTVPCLSMVANQTFPRWIYYGDGTYDDNITNNALDRFQAIYKDLTITKDNIFNYIYGVLHAPDYRERFGTDLRLSLPRIPLAEDFWAFADAGDALADLHLNYHLDGDPRKYEDLGVLLNDNPIFPDMIQDEHYAVKKMRWEERPEGYFIKYNAHLSIGPIPSTAFDYTVCERSPLQWIIDYYQITTDKPSGISNDPNDWIKAQNQPDALVRLIERICFVSTASAKIIKNLPRAVKE